MRIFEADASSGTRDVDLLVPKELDLPAVVVDLDGPRPVAAFDQHRRKEILRLVNGEVQNAALGAKKTETCDCLFCILVYKPGGILANFQKENHS